MTRARGTSPNKRKTTQASEALELRAEALDVTVKSLKACQHPSSLIYFDRIYGAQCSWEVCDTCGLEFHMTELVPPEHIRQTEAAWSDSHGYHYYNDGGEP